MDKGKQAVENMKNLRGSGGPLGSLVAGAVVVGGTAYGLYNSLYNGMIDACNVFISLSY